MALSLLLLWGVLFLRRFLRILTLLSFAFIEKKNASVQPAQRWVPPMSRWSYPGPESAEEENQIAPPSPTQGKRRECVASAASSGDQPRG